MTVKAEKVIIGTRGSVLAMRQAQSVADKIANIGYDVGVKVRKIKTSGDWKPCQGEVRLDPDKGGKALFAKEIEEALLNGHIDMAVHSMKDLETDMPEGLCVPCMLPRADARDAFLSRDPRVVHFNDLPKDSVVGTASIRRQAFLLKQRTDLHIVPIRGNVETRLDKLKNGQVDALFLAIAGLERLGLEGEARCVLSPEEMLPSAGQGAIGVQIREADLNRLNFISQINCDRTYVCVEAERAVLRALGATCHTPIGVYATLNPVPSSWRDKNVRSPCMLGAASRVRGVSQNKGRILNIKAQVVSPDGKESWEQHMCKHVLGLEEARAIGHSIGVYLKERVPISILG